MSASEFAFLALGLVLGVASGAALMEVIRSRPPTPRVVRLTVAPDAVPRRRPTTLASGGLNRDAAEVARGGPADRRGADRGAPRHGPAAVPEPAPAAAVEVPARRPTPAAVPAAWALTTAPLAAAAGSMIGVPIHREPDPGVAALRRIAAAAAERSMRVASGVAVLDRPPTNRSAMSPAEPEGARAASAGGGAGASGAAEPEAAGPCAEERRVAEERCAHASRAREQAETAHDALRSAQRAYDDHLTRADRAAADADPRAVRAAKETAQQVFRAARGAATSRDAVEAAARDWLGEINRINIAARDAAVLLERERSQATALVTEIERLTVAADAARIGAESAEAACIAAREALAACQEAASEPVSSLRTSPDEAAVQPSPRARYEQPQQDRWDSDEAAAIALATGQGEPAILRLVRGDRATLATVAAALAGDDPTARRHWQVALSGLVEAVVARAIEAAALDFPTDHPFWGPFTRSQNREIAAALSSLGYRYDGLGGWQDGRVPSQRDLSLALGYAGLDPMRIRHWPNEAEMVELYHDVTVAADEYLVETAGGLTLGELVTVLGLRADALTDLWNEWGRVRPLLLAAS